MGLRVVNMSIADSMNHEQHLFFHLGQMHTDKVYALPRVAGFILRLPSGEGTKETTLATTITAASSIYYMLYDNDIS